MHIFGGFIYLIFSKICKKNFFFSMTDFPEIIIFFSINTYDIKFIYLDLAQFFEQAENIK